MNKKQTFAGCIAALSAEAIYGLSYMFTKTATNSSSAIDLLAWRFIIALIAINLLVVLGIIKINLRNKNLKKLILLTMLSPVFYFIGETVGINYTSTTESGIILACIPVASVVAATVILKNKPSRTQLIGICITLVGVAVTTVATGVTASFSIIGYAFLMFAVISYAVYSALISDADEFSSAEVTYVMIVVGAVVFITVAILYNAINGSIINFATLPFHNTLLLKAILFQGIFSSVLAFLLTIKALNIIGVNRTSSFVGVSTVVSILSGIIILKEQILISQIIGALIIIVGVYIANAKK